MDVGIVLTVWFSLYFILLLLFTTAIDMCVKTSLGNRSAEIICIMPSFMKNLNDMFMVSNSTRKYNDKNSNRCKIYIGLHINN